MFVRFRERVVLIAGHHVGRSADVHHLRVGSGGGVRARPPRCPRHSACRGRAARARGCSSSQRERYPRSPLNPSPLDAGNRVCTPSGERSRRSSYPWPLHAASTEGFSSSPWPFGDFALLMRVVDRRTRAGFLPVAPRRGGGRRSSPTRARRASATRGTQAPRRGRRQAPGGASPTVTGSLGVRAGSRTRALRSRTDVPTPGRRAGAEPAGRFRGEGGLPRQRCRPARSHRGRRGRRRGIGRSVFSVPPRAASLLALSRAMRASSPAWRTEVFSFSPLSRCASRRRSSSRFSVVRICMSMASRCRRVKAGRWSGGARGELDILSPRQNPHPAVIASAKRGVRRSRSLAPLWVRRG